MNKSEMMEFILHAIELYVEGRVKYAEEDGFAKAKSEVKADENTTKV